MSDGTNKVVAGPNNPAWTEDLLFTVLSDPVRREMLLSLARKSPQTAAALIPVVGRQPARLKVNNTIKHLGRLRELGLVTAAENPNDGRKLLYSLSLALTLKKMEEDSFLVVGRCFLRL